MPELKWQERHNNSNSSQAAPRSANISPNNATRHLSPAHMLYQSYGTSIFIKPLLGLMLTLSVVLLCVCIPAGADERPLKPGQSFKDCATDCPEMVVIP